MPATKYERIKRAVVFHPFLFAIYCILGLYSQNSSQVPLAWVWRPLLFILVVTGFIYFPILKKFGDHGYAGFVGTLFLNWFFMGYMYRYLLETSSFWHTAFGGLLALLIVSLPIYLLTKRRLWEKLSMRDMVTLFLNATSVVLIIFPLWTTAGILLRGTEDVKMVKTIQSGFEVSLNKTSTPDIYIIIVDGYGREDFLQDVYGYDNSGFVTFLEKNDFYVASHATSNYPQTQLSIPSLLNLQYLNDAVRALEHTDDRMGLYELVQHPIIRDLLHEQGYTFMALPSASLSTQIRDADVFFDVTGIDINEFEAFLLSSTVAGVAVESWGVKLPVMGYDLHRRYTLFTLETLREIPSMPGPKLVFAHIMLPHPPFIFDKNGNYSPPDRPFYMGDGSFFPGTPEEYQHGYTGQMSFLNDELENVVSDILARSEQPPIVILQGDHGPGSMFNLEEPLNPCLKERYSILSAYYFPDGDYNSLYESITPVNSFRVILNKYFGADLELLEDRNYYSTWSDPFNFIDVTEDAQSCEMITKQSP